MTRLLLCFVSLVALAGCDSGPEEPQRGKLEGQVTLNGKPVKQGTIRFFALDPNGINVAADIQDGRYSVPEGQGPSKGKYRVEFSVPSDKKTRIENPDLPGEWLEEAVELLPPKYHRDSQIVQDYDPATEKSYDFKLTTP
jgi:hypothetical protein